MSFKIKFNSLRKDINKFLVFSSGTVISALISFFTIRIININLSEYELGRFTYLQSVFQILFIVLSLNLYNSYLRFNTNGILKKLVKFVRIVSMIMVIIFSIIIYLFSKNISALLFSFIIIYYERMYFYRSVSDYKTFNIIIISASLVTFICCYFYSIYSPYLDSSNLFLFYGLGYFCAMFFFKNKQSLRTNEKATFSKLEVLKYSLPLIGLTLTEIVFNFSNQFFIKQFQGYGEVAKYAIAFKSLFFVRFIASLFLIHYPVIYFREIEKGNLALVNYYRNLIVFFLLLAVTLMFLFSKNIYLLMGGENYLPNVFLFEILLVADFLRICTSFFSLIFTFQIKPYISLIFQILGLMLNVICCLLLVPKFGAFGACISSLISIGIVFLVNIIYSRKVENEFISKLSL